MEKDPCWGVIYLIVLCDHLFLVTFCRSAIPTSCYILNVFYYLLIILAWITPPSR